VAVAVAAMSSSADARGYGQSRAERMSTPSDRTLSEDTGSLKGDLEQIRQNLLDIREHNRLMMAYVWMVESDRHQRESRRIARDTQFVIDAALTRLWNETGGGTSGAASGAASTSAQETPSMKPTAPARHHRYGGAAVSAEWGTASRARFAHESEAAAFIRNALWQVNSDVQRDLLAGGPVRVPTRDIALMDAAIAKADSPMVEAALVIPTPSQIAMRTEESTTTTTTTTTPPSQPEAGATTSTEGKSETTTTTPAPEQPPAPPAEATPSATEATPPPAEETPAPEATPAPETTPPAGQGGAELPKTGGSPLGVVLSGLAMVSGGLILRRKP